MRTTSSLQNGSSLIEVLPLPDGIESLRRRLGSPPLVAHIRHLSSAAPIAGEVPVHVDGPYAAPATSEAYERWLDQCVAWGMGFSRIQRLICIVSNSVLDRYPFYS